MTAVRCRRPRLFGLATDAIARAFRFLVSTIIPAPDSLPQDLLTYPHLSNSSFTRPFNRWLEHMRVDTLVIAKTDGILAPFCVFLAITLRNGRGIHGKHSQEQLISLSVHSLGSSSSLARAIDYAGPLHTTLSTEELVVNHRNFTPTNPIYRSPTVHHITGSSTSCRLGIRAPRTDQYKANAQGCGPRALDISNTDIIFSPQR